MKAYQLKIFGEIERIDCAIIWNDKKSLRRQLLLCSRLLERQKIFWEGQEDVGSNERPYGTCCQKQKKRIKSGKNHSDWWMTKCHIDFRRNHNFRETVSSFIWTTCELTQHSLCSQKTFICQIKHYAVFFFSQNLSQHSNKFIRQLTELTVLFHERFKFSGK